MTPFEILMAAAPVPPPLKPHIRSGGPPVTIGDPDPDPDREVDPRLAKIETYFLQQALRAGKSRGEAAAIARGQVLNYLFKLGLFKPIPSSREF